MGHAPQESVGGVLISLSRPWACSWINQLSLRYGQCDARPTVTFPDAWHHRPLTGTNFTAWRQRHMCVNNLPKVVAWKWNRQEWNPWPFVSWASTLTITLRVSYKFHNIMYLIVYKPQAQRKRSPWQVHKPVGESKDADGCTDVQSYTHTHAHTHTHTRLTALCPGLPGWAGTRKVKSIWILLEQETVSGSGISWDICKTAHNSRQITTPAPHRSVFFTGRMPNQQRQSTEGK